jgi:YD repeat-containing protein
MVHPSKQFRLVFLIFILLVNKMYGQTNVDLPAVVSPSPQSQALTRYGDYPMASYTGLTDITIPIHTVTGRKLSLPITMSFHASGMMAGETEGVLGMRWTLNCGGLVTRTMKGTPDEWNYLDPLDINAISENPPFGGPTFDMLYNSCTDGKIHGLYSINVDGPSQPVKWYDSEYDIFNYSLPNGKSGHFILKGMTGAKVAMTIPYDPIKIEFAKAPTDNGYIENLTITDVDGTRYKFGKIDASTSNAVESNLESDIVDNRLGDVSTAWYLTKIISNDGTDEISLFYNTRPMASYSAVQTATIRDRLREFQLSSWFSGSSDAYMLSLQEDLIAWHFDQTDVIVDINTKNNVPLLSSIQFNGGSALFSYTSTGFYTRLLSDIVINRDAVPFKKVSFEITVPQYGTTHFLNNVSFYGEDQTTLAEKYNFNYYSGGSYSPQESARWKDWWGYCAGGGQGLILQQIAPIVKIPFGDVTSQNIGYSWVNREADENSKMGGMLKTITYPTGGQTEFVYENNKYDWTPYYQAGVNSFTLDGPGLRIKEVISTPVTGKPVHKIYKYGIYEDGRGFIDDCLRPGSAAFADLKVMESNTMHYWTYVYGPDPNDYGSNNEAGHRTRRYFSDPYISFDLSGSNIKYDAVTEYVLELEGNSEIPVPRQKTQMRYAWGDNAQLTTFNVTDRDENMHHYRKFSNPENAWRTPVMTGKTFYKYENGQFTPSKTETYTYAPWEKDHAWDMPTYLHTNIVYALLPTATGQSGYSGKIDNYLTAKVYDQVHCSVYGWGYRKYVTGTQVLLSTKVEEFTPTGSIVTQKDMDYNDDNHFLRSETITNSKNEVINIAYSYPTDFETTSPYNVMVQRNIISPVVQQVKINTTLNKELERTKTNFNLWQSNTVIQPATIQKSIDGNALETEATINDYDNKGNILQVTGKDGIVTSYIWGYDQKYPVAKIVGKSYTDAVALSGINLSTVNNTTSTDQTIRTETNKLRVLSNCFVSTYTYKPLTGMTSETDPNGRTTYYEYDNFGRLAYIKDKDNNILKKICYNYQGQTESCPLQTGNTAKSGIFTRNNCGSGYSGGTVTYTVPANTYFGSNADALALADVNANGQAYANQHGSCTPTSPNQTIYARIEVVNFDESSGDDYYSDGSHTVYHYKTGDIWVKFYTDATCTTPLTLTSPITVNWSNSGFMETSNYYNSGTYPQSTNVPANVTGFELSNLSSLGGQTYWHDSEDNLIDYEYYRDYWSLTSNGTVYIIVQPNELPESW